MSLRFSMLVACFLPVIASADQITLKNGDKVTGIVIKKDAKELIFKSDAFGQFVVAWDKVQAISTAEPVYVVVPGDRTVVGPIETKGDQVQIGAADARQEAGINDLVAIRNSDEQKAYERLLRPPWSRLWVGNAALGLAGARGNARSLTFTALINASRVTTTDKSTIYLNGIRSTAEVEGVSDITAQAIRAGWVYGHNISKRWVWNVFNDYEYDRFQNLDLRVVLGGGIGYILWQREASRLDIVAGASWNRESFGANRLQPGLVRNSAEAFVGDDFTYKVNATTNIVQSTRYFSNLSNTGEYRLNGDIAATTKLTKWLTWNLTFSDRYLSNPVVGRRNNDFLYATGLGISFSRY